MLSCSEDLAEEKKFAGVVNATPSPGKDGVEDEEKSAVRISDERTLMESSTDNLPAPVDNQYPQGLRLGFIVVALVMSVFLVALDLTILGTAIPKIVDEFGQLELVGWVSDAANISKLLVLIQQYTSSFLITMAAFQSAWGKAFKYFPLKPGFIFCICIFELGSLICGKSLPLKLEL